MKSEIIEAEAKQFLAKVKELNPEKFSFFNKDGNYTAFFAIPVKGRYSHRCLHFRDLGDGHICVLFSDGHEKDGIANALKEAFPRILMPV